MKLDLKDQKILHAIEFDARAPISNIARKVRLSKEVTNYRIRRLEEEGIISDYTTVFNLFNLGKDYYALFFKINDYYALEGQIMRYLHGLERRSRIMVCDGRWNLAFTMRANSMQQLTKDIHGFLEKYGEFIEDKQVLFINEMFISKCHFLYPNFKKEPHDILHISSTGKADKSITQLERLITLKLAINPRRPLNQLAADLRIDVKTLKKYMTRLAQKKIIVGYRTYINSELLGFKRFNVFIAFKNLSSGKNKELIEYLKYSPNVPVIYTCFGMADLVFEMVVSDVSDLFRFLRELSMRYSRLIKRYEFLPIVKYERKSN